MLDLHVCAELQIILQAISDHPVLDAILFPPCCQF